MICDGDSLHHRGTWQVRFLHVLHEQCVYVSKDVSRQKRHLVKAIYLCSGDSHLTGALGPQRYPKGVAPRMQSTLGPRLVRAAASAPASVSGLWRSPGATGPGTPTPEAPLDAVRAPDPLPGRATGNRLPLRPRIRNTPLLLRPAASSLALRCRV